MKKSNILKSLTALTLVFGLASCVDPNTSTGGTSSNPSEQSSPSVHEHSFAAEWSKDENHHWHAATCEHADAIEKLVHVWNEGVVTTPATEEAPGVKTFTCGDCGYTKTEDGWIDGNGQPVTGVMSILADTQIGSVSADMNDIQIGSVMGHEYSEADGKWYQNGVELTGVMAVFADLTINEMSDTNKVSDKMSEMFDSMTMGEYHEKGILSLDSATVTTLDTVAVGWRDQSINGFIPFLISKLANPTIPTP